MPAGSYLMTSSFSYRKLKKLPDSSHQERHDQQLQRQPTPATSSIQDYYQKYYRALGAAVARTRKRRQGATSRAGWGRGRRRRWGKPRLRVSSLARALRRKAAAVGRKVRASVGKVAARLREGGPYIGDLFAGNYMFLQVTPSSAADADLDGSGKGFAAPFAEYYYGRVMSRRPPPALQLHAAAVAGTGI